MFQRNANPIDLEWVYKNRYHYLNNRVLLSKALLIWTSNFRGNLSHIGPETEGLYCFYCTTHILSENCHKRALYADRYPLRRDTVASRDRFRPIGAHQNLALYYNQQSRALFSFVKISSSRSRPVNRWCWERMVVNKCSASWLRKEGDLVSKWSFQLLLAQIM